MTVCDLCGKAKRCLKKEIEGKEYDICRACWSPLEEKLKGKGRPIKERETVFLPPARVAQSLEKEEKPQPGEPPKIWSSARQLH